MTTVIPEGAMAEAPVISTPTAAKQALTSPWASLAAVVLAVVWTVPTAGLLISSFRPETDVKTTGWWHVFTSPHFTLDNYRQVLSSGSQTDLTGNLVNTIVITLPAVIIPIFLATMAAYAFAWMRFPAKNFLFVMVFALQIVPIQVCLIPLLKLYNKPPFNLMPIHGGQNPPAGGLYSVWLSHTIFALPLAIFLLHNFMREIPGELVESARVDGAGHVQIFARIMLPLMMPAIAAFAVLQFLWVWNDLLVAIIFGQSTPPLTKALTDLTGTRGQDWPLLTAGAFVSMVIPLIVFLAMQRFFVRGLLAGSVKG
ncbi:carbohydrate ABC transporter permease [Nocardioides sp. BP30]|uniref:carbohydrate ABC transporter permease n=1 Tax=Nocardioides sp. BP30 TaxID=3036374 RepID=UPI0024699F11|nr:carbohydrate ABC transporter permease [Nocardioides sp. BP30]WGL53188.1 carbohydrate ABC transporter permease [Nocardioides sp. BP30]